MEKQFKYDAFISYRHVEPDQTIAARLHTMLETFTLPMNLRADGKNRKFRVFRDREELSAADLSDSIQDALQHSANLIVICTKQTPLSPWCAKEIETFRKFHGDSHIIAVLAEGEPDESFPASLLDLKKELTLEDGTTEFVERELLAAELRPEEVLDPAFPGYAALLAENSPQLGILAKKSAGLLKTEIYRIVAGMLGVSFGDLKQRDKERRLRRTLQLVSAGAAVMLVFGVVMLNLYWRADAAELQSTQQSSLMTMNRAMEQVQNGDRMTGALVGKTAMDAAREQMPAYERLAAQYTGVLNDALYTDAYETTSVLDTGSTSPFFSAAGTEGRMLTSGEGNHALIWDLETGETVFSLEHPLPVFSLAMSDDGRFAYTGALDGNLYEWNAQTGKNLRVIPLTDGASDIRPTRDNRTMVVARVGGGVDLWDIETNAITNLAFPENRRLHRAAMHPDGTSMVVAYRSVDGSIPLGEVENWSLETGQRIGTFDIGKNERGSEFNSDPKYSADGSVLVLTTPMGISVEYADGTGKRIDDPGLAFLSDYAVTADGRYLYAPDNYLQNANVDVWDLDAGKKIGTLTGRPGSIDRIAVSKDGKTVAASWNDHMITAWNTELKDSIYTDLAYEIAGHTGRVTGLRFSDDSAYLLSGSMDGTVRVTPTVARDAGQLLEGVLLAVSGNHEHLLFKRTDENFTSEYYTWSWDGEPVKAGGLDDANLFSMFAISNDGKTAAYSRTGASNAAVVDLETGTVRRQTSAHELSQTSINALAGMAFSPDGTQIATLGEDGVIKRMRVDTGSVEARITGLPKGNLSLRWSDDGQLLAGETMSGKTVIFTAEGAQLAELDGALHALYKDDDGYAGIGLMGDELFRWTEKEGTQPIAMTRERRGISDRQLNKDALSKDRSMMLSVVLDEVVLTDIKTGERIRTLETAGNIERNGTFSPDGKTVLYTYADNTSKMISLHGPDELQNALQTRLGGRQLSDKELEAIGR